MDKDEATTLTEADGAPAKKIWGNACSGADLKEVLQACSKWLSEHTEAINALNVFPVPDGDTGTNMSRTMEAAVAELDSLDGSSTAEAVGKKLSYGALMGARGNSGVILSQIIRGLAQGLTGKETVTANDLAHALTQAKEMAYKAVMKPVEGTLLTVVRESAEAAVEAAKLHNNFVYVLTETVAAAKESVARTPTLLTALREAGVVDAGGHGYFVILEGALRHLRGESLVKTALSEVEKAKPKFTVGADGDDEHANMDEFGYCTNFMLYADNDFDFDNLRDTIAAMGTSAVIVGQDRMLKVHIHTEDPGGVLSYVTKLGALGQIKLDNMNTQHEEAFKQGKAGAALEAKIKHDEDIVYGDITGSIGIVTVASGDGLLDAFLGLGANAVVRGGQSMNPSTQELLKAVEHLEVEQIIILPNNKNILMAARQVPNFTKKQVAVVPSATIPQGIMALSRLNLEQSLDNNAQQMTAALKDIGTGEVTRAVRTATVNNITVTSGQWIGLFNDELTVAAASKEDTVWQLLDQMKATSTDLITLYYGQDVSEAEADTFSQQVQARFPKQEVVAVPGGQPLYHYIISAE